MITKNIKLKTGFGIYGISLFVVGLIVLWSCDADDDGMVIPSPASPGVVNFYLSALPWEQDSIESVYAIINNAEISGPGVSQDLFEDELPRIYNLVDSGLFIGSQVLDSGLYNRFCIELEANLKSGSDDDDDDGGGLNYPPSFLEFTNNALVPLFTTQTRFCVDDTLRVQPGDSLVVLLEVNLENSLRIDTVYTGGRDDDDDDNGRRMDDDDDGDDGDDDDDNGGQGDNDDDDDGDNDDDDDGDGKDEIEIRYCFDPDFELVVPFGIVEGEFSRARRNIEYRVFAYEQGTFDVGEVSQDFVNAVESVSLDQFRRYTMSLLPGEYQLLIYSFQRGMPNRQEGPIVNNLIIEPRKIEIVNF